ncbi:hypothetical protein KIN20_036523 [Parelaphostrongylus tenuis]|uniref:Secreted protein n=1 Tax=Parelaphostrongylus tenuis TaxID=148309 RepID=A0AAD5RDK7_PARTN|nr:hypothetical protein KIN20_036523 [Parelaphostrongylus tenuis]
MARTPKTCLFAISLLATISTALGCGVIPSGQASTRNFTVSGLHFACYHGLQWRDQCSCTGVWHFIKQGDSYGICFTSRNANCF